MSGEKNSKDSVLEGLALGVGFVIVGVSRECKINCVNNES